MSGRRARFFRLSPLFGYCLAKECRRQAQCARQKHQLISIGEYFVCACAKPAALTPKIASSTAHNLRPPSELKAAISIECLTMGIDFPSNRDELDVMMRSMAAKSPQTRDQNSSNAHQSRARRAFAEPVIAFLEKNPNNFRPVRRG